MAHSILHILFWASFSALLHTYLLYPALLRWWLRALPAYEPGNVEHWPFVSVLMAVYNEEAVIEEKLDSLSALDYPPDRLRIYIGSDASTDRTNALIAERAAGWPQLHFYPFAERQGKPRLINQLVPSALAHTPAGRDHIFLMTDANVLLKKDLLRHLIPPFEVEETGLVDAHMVNEGVGPGGIGRSEQQYISNEVWIKHAEGRLWGSMMGPFGGCYALRSDYWTPVPSNFLVDDFFINMKVLEKGGKTMNVLDALCFEKVPNELGVEFRRKKRISAGNYQNLFTFRRMLWPFWKGKGFAFLSHKVLRWKGPFLILIMCICAFLLSWQHVLYGWIFGLLVFLLFGVPLLDRLLQYLHIHWLPLRSAAYFVWMNMALLAGFFKFLKGIKSNVWERTKRQ